MEQAGASDDVQVRPGVLAAPAAILLVIALLVGLDAVSDLRAGGSTAHLIVEVAVMAVAIAGTVLLWGELLAARRRARTFEVNLGRAEADLARFRKEAEEHVRGLGAAIDHQFARWELSAAEREVALLLLKGLSSKEIAAVRGTSERTVRQQALAVYRKAKLASRAELAAFFLEDLLSAVPSAGGATAEGGSGGEPLR